MALVTVTFKVGDLGLDAITAEHNPRLWVQLVGGSQVGDGLLADVEKRADFDPVTGVGSAQVDSFPGVLYRFVLDWTLPDPRSAPEHWQRRRTTWPPFYPGTGGDVSALAPFAGIRGFVFGFGPGPSKWLRNVVYLDLADPDGIGVYGPKGASVAEVAV